MDVAAKNLYSQQGIGGFYRGIEANVMRAMVLNGTKMSCYDQIKVSPSSLHFTLLLPIMNELAGEEGEGEKKTTILLLSCIRIKSVLLYFILFCYLTTSLCLSLSSDFAVHVKLSLSLSLPLLFISLLFSFCLLLCLSFTSSLSHSLSLSIKLFLFSLSLCLPISLSLSICQGIIVKSQAIPAGLPTQFCAAFGAGFFMACTVAPFDMVSEWVSHNALLRPYVESQSLRFILSYSFPSIINIFFISLALPFSLLFFYFSLHLIRSFSLCLSISFVLSLYLSPLLFSLFSFPLFRFALVWWISPVMLASTQEPETVSCKSLKKTGLRVFMLVSTYVHLDCCVWMSVLRDEKWADKLNEVECSGVESI